MDVLFQVVYETTRRRDIEGHGGVPLERSEKNRVISSQSVFSGEHGV